MNHLKQILKWTLIGLLSFTTFNLFISGKIEESIKIEAPIDVVYLRVADLTTWSEWQKKDTTMTTKHFGEITGLGAKMSWTGINGSGSLEIIEANLFRNLKNELIYEGMPPSYSTWTFKETDKGTRVTWGFEEELPFYVRFMQLFITSELEDGLIGLKKICE